MFAKIQDFFITKEKNFISIIMKIPFYLSDISEKEIESVVKTLRSGWINTGPRVIEFEGLVKKKSFKHALATNSATAGLFCILKAMGIGRGDEVITSPYTFTATASAIIQAGAKVVLCDIGEDYNMNPKLINRLLNKRTKAVIPVDFGGKGCDIFAIKSILDLEKKKFHPNNDIQAHIGRPVVLNDSSHAFGSRRGEQFIGTESDFAVFSFHAVKNITTADGGMIVSTLNSDVISNFFAKLRKMILHGMSRSSLDRVISGGWQYDVEDIGFKFNMTDLSASLGLAQLNRWEEFEKKRFSLYTQYQKRLNNNDKFELWQKDDETLPHLFPLTVKKANEKSRNKIIEKLQSLGITCNVHFKPLPLLTFYRRLGYQIKDYPISFKMYEREISLPFYPGLSKEKVDYVCDALNNAI